MYILTKRRKIYYREPSLRIDGPSPWLDVRAWGAKGDGLTDDTLAIQKAIDQLPVGGGRIYIPAGTYKITDTIKIIHANAVNDDTYGIGLQIFGDGPDATIIKGNLTSKDLLASKDKSHVYNHVRISDLSISNTSRDNAGAIGINLDNISRAYLENLWIYDVNTGIYGANRSWWNTVIHCTIGWDLAGGTRGTRTGIKLTGTTLPANEWHIISNNIRVCDNGIILDPPAGQGLTNTVIAFNAIEAYATTAISNGDTQTTQNTKIIGNRVENQSAAGTAFKDNSGNSYSYYSGNHVPDGSFATLFSNVPNTAQIQHRGQYRGGIVTSTATGTTTIALNGNETILWTGSGALTLTDISGGLFTGMKCTLVNNGSATITLQNGANIGTKTGVDRNLTAGNTTMFHRISGKWMEIGG